MSVKTAKYNQKIEKIGEIELSEKFFDIELNSDLVHQAMVAQMSNMRQVLAHTKGKADVRGGGAKPWRQKGTGRARVGSRRSPLWIGGGVTFGPLKSRNFSKDINKKMRRKAINMVLTDRLKNNALIIVDEIKMDQFKTKNFVQLIKKIENNFATTEEKKKKNNDTFLAIIDNIDEKTKCSASNIPNFKTINLNNINIIDLLQNKYLIVTEASVKSIEKKSLK